MVRKTANQRLAEREERARSELLDHLFEPWIGGAGNAETLARIGPVDTQDATAMTQALHVDILPLFNQMTAETQHRLRAAMTVLARSDGEEFRAYWLDLRPPFGVEASDADAVFQLLAPLLDVRVPDVRKGPSTGY